MSLIHLHRPEIRMVTASSRKAQVLNSRRRWALSGTGRSDPASVERGQLCRLPGGHRPSAGPPRIPNPSFRHVDPGARRVSESCGNPCLVASALTCRPSQVVVYEDFHHWRRHRIVAARRWHRQRGHLRVRDGVLKPRRHRRSRRRSPLPASAPPDSTPRRSTAGPRYRCVELRNPWWPEDGC
jgi:hypothetical protein